MVLERLKTMQRKSMLVLQALWQGRKKSILKFKRYEHNVLHDKIFAALKSLRDPAKLVLDMSKSFFETGLDEVENDAIRKRCVYLLEQLIKISPSITPDVEHEAREFAGFWKQKLNWAKFSKTHFGYLQFLAAYQLAMSCKGKDLLSLFKASYFAATLYPPEKIVDLCCALGLQDKIPGRKISLRLDLGYRNMKGDLKL
ncbi:FRIGIDA-like protein 5 [Silene latifolia]|uniref:FRIGIDA-like protein 5 n=1 Tax=Silene latifolia TaxID=37657 RepID=UPI003D77C646